MFKIILALILTVGIAQASYIPPDVKVNMLVNGDFELPTLAGWTCSTGTCTKTTTSGEFSSGLAAMKVGLAAQSMNISQTITTPAGIQSQGSFGIIYRIPSGIVTPTLTVTVDSVLQTTLPTSSLIQDDKYHSIEIPLTFGATDVKVSMLSGSSTGSVYFDAAYVKQGISNGSLSVDTDWVSYTPTGSWTSGVTYSGKTRRMGDSREFDVSLNITGSVTATSLTINMLTGEAVDTAKVTSVGQIGSGSYWDNSAANGGLVYVRQVGGAVQVLSSTGGPVNGTVPVTWSTSDEIHLTFSVPIVGWSSNSSTYSQANAKSLAMQTSFSAQITAAPSTVTINSQNIPFLSSCAYTSAGVGTCTFSPGIFTVTPLCTIASNSGQGAYASTGTVTSSTIPYRLVASGVPTDGTATVSCQKVGVDYINALSPSIVGSFAGYTSVPGYTGNVDTFSVSYGTTNLSTVCSTTPCLVDQFGQTATTADQSGGAKNITRASTGVYTLNFNRTYSKIKCTSSGLVGTSGVSAVNYSGSRCEGTCTSVALTTLNSATQAFVDTFGTLQCQGTY
jgi:hypothetical protein